MPALTPNPFYAQTPIEKAPPPQRDFETRERMRQESLLRAPSRPSLPQRIATGPVGDVISELLEGFALPVDVAAGAVGGIASATVRPFASVDPTQAAYNLLRGRDPRPEIRAQAREFDKYTAPLIHQPVTDLGKQALEYISSPFTAAEEALVRKGLNPEDARLAVETGALFLPLAGKGAKVAARGARRGFRAVRELGQRGEVGIGKTDPASVNVSLKKANVTKELQELGFDEPTKVETFEFHRALDEAKTVLERDSTAGSKLATEALESARALNPVEKATLLHERTRISNLRDQADATLRTAEKAGDQLGIDTARANLEAVRTEYQTVSEAALLQGRESGLSLAFQKMMLKRDYSLANLERQRRTVKGGPLSEQALQETKGMHERITKAEAKLGEKVKELREIQMAGEKSIREILEKPKEPPVEVTGERGISAEEGKRPEKMFFILEKGKEGITPNELKPVSRGQSVDIQAVKEGTAVVGVDLKTMERTIHSSKGLGLDKDVLAKFKDLLDKKEPELIRERETVHLLEKEKLPPKERKPLTDKQLVARATASLERSVKDLETRIKEKDLRPRRAITTPPTPEILELRARRDGLRAELKELRDLAKPRRTTAEINLARQKTRLRNQTAKLQERLELKDFTKREREPVILDKEGRELQLAYDKAKEAFDDALFKDQLAKRSTSRKVLDTGKEALNISRAIVTSLDLSAVLRQGGFTAFAHPIRALQSFPAMIKALRSEAGQLAVMTEIKGRKNAPLYRQSRLFLAERSKGLVGMEEVYMSRFADKIPVVAASQRAYVTFLNKLRADSFDAMARSLGKEGVVTLPEAKAIANFVNVATGRGAVTASTTALVNMNTVFFAPRLVLSRFQLLTGQPLRASSSPRVARLIAGEYGRFLAGLGTVYALGQLAGGEIENDPRSSDFGKLKFGNTRVDPLTGLAQVSTFSARVGTQQTKGLKSGEIRSLTGKEASKFGARNLFDVISTFFRTKLSPGVGAAIDIGTGTDVVGDQATAEATFVNLLTPLAMRDIYEAMQEQGVPGVVALSLLAIFGMGVQSFDVTKRRRRDRRGFFSAERLKEKVGLGKNTPVGVNPFLSKTPRRSNLTANPF